MKYSYMVKGHPYLVELQREKDGYRVLVGEHAQFVRANITANGVLDIEFGDQVRHAVFAKEGRHVWVHIDGKSYHLEKAAGSASGTVAVSGELLLRAPMPGQVRQVLVAAGAHVKAGETLVLLEAMKMEIRIQAPQQGKVARVAVSEGQSVEKDQLLVELDYEAK